MLKKHPGRILLYIIFFLLCGTLVPAQELHLNFRQISYKEGLVQSPISNFLQDDKGFIWFGTLKGLNRYDGYEFKTFRYDERNKTSLTNNRVNTIFQDSDKNLWVGTANGVNLYNRNTETFSPVDVLEIKGGRNYISAIIEDQQRNIWVGTFAGIRKLNRTTMKLEEAGGLSKTEALRSEAVFSLFLDRNNIIWAGTKRGLRKFDPVSGRLQTLLSGFDPIAKRSNIIVLVTRQDSTGNLWFGTESAGVFKHEQNRKALIRYVSADQDSRSLASNWVKDILIYNSKSIWFATRNGISMLDLTSGKFSLSKHDPLKNHSLNDNAIWCFMKDKASCVWVGTFTGGINFYYQGNSNFQNIGESMAGEMGLNHILVNDIAEDEDESLWIGTFGGGLNHINRAKGTSEYFLVRSLNHGRAANGVKSLGFGGKDHLWIGSLDGLSLYNKKTRSFKYFNFPVTDGKLSENLINTLLPDEKGAWVGTNGGGLRYVLPDGTSSILLKKESGPHRLPSASLSDNFVTALLGDLKGNLWIGTQNGLNYYDTHTGKITHLYKKVRDTRFQLNNNNISTLFNDSKGRLWIGTEGGGLNYFDPSTQRFYAISKKLGLGDDVIHAIVEDRQQNLWLSTDLGLFKLMIRKFRLPFSSKDLEITSYTANDGLINNQFSGNAALRLSSGELIFGGINGLSVFYPHKIIKNTLPPQVALTQAMVNNKPVKIDSAGSPLERSISEAGRLVLHHDQSNLSLRYSALNFINAENNRYAYKLEGLSNGDEWQQAGTERVVNFANLSPGKYRFKVKAANNDGIWGSTVRSLDIVVLPPWWRTWWAYFIEGLMVIALLFVFINFMRNRAILKRDLFLEQVNHSRQQELYQMKLDFFTNISHEIRTPLTLIIGPLEKLMAAENQGGTAKQLGLIRHNADRLMKLVTELLDFRKAEEGHLRIQFAREDLVPFCRDICKSFEGLAIEKNIGFQFQASHEVMELYFQKDQLEKVIFNLLSNAFKFTPSGEEVSLQINDSVEDDEIEITVWNTGNYIPEEIQAKLFDSFFQSHDAARNQPGTGVGLALSKSIVELHKGTISVFSRPGTPAVTVFVLRLQKGRGHISDEELAKDHFNDATDAFVVPRTSHHFSDDPESSIVAGQKKYTVLVAEDNADVRNLITDTLKQEYTIVDFDNGTDALSYTQSNLPDLIISDVMMPGMNGLELCAAVKSAESTSHIPVILLTAKAAVSDQVDGLSMGANVYISKPFSLQVLMLNVRNLMNAQEVMRAKFSEQLILQPSNIQITTPEEKFIQKLMRIIEEKMGDPDFDVTALVNEMGMSRTVLYKKVQALTGFAVADLIKYLRLQKAAALLQSSSMPVAEVAYMVGFNDRKHFSREFRKQHGISPSTFQQQPQTGG